jgi:hypothetical protein
VKFNFEQVLLTLKILPMKPGKTFKAVLLIVSIAFGFASCSSDNELKPSKRMVDDGVVHLVEAGKITPAVDGKE